MTGCLDWAFGYDLQFATPIGTGYLYSLPASRPPWST